MGNEIVELFKKKADAPMPRVDLEKHLVNFIGAHNMCVLATCLNNVPRATPIEYYADGTTLYMICDPGTKMEQMKANPHVSIGVHDPLDGWMSVRGVQITGTVEFITRTENPRAYDDAMRIYRWQNLGKDIGQTEPPQKYTLIKITAQKIELMEFALKKQGYHYRQVWEARPVAE